MHDSYKRWREELRTLHYPGSSIMLFESKLMLVVNINANPRVINKKHERSVIGIH
jgi:hypothetical protein